MTRIAALCAFVVCLITCAVSKSGDPKSRGPELRVLRNKADFPIAVEAVGLPAAELKQASKQDDADERFARMLALFVVNDPPVADVPPMAGIYAVVESSLRFTPRFPWAAGARYRAVLRPEALVSRPEAGVSVNQETPGRVTLTIIVPAEQPGPQSEVVHVYPSSGMLPENNLRFYIHFSESMARGEAYQHLRLLDAKGRMIEEAFLEITKTEEKAFKEAVA